MPTLLVRMQVKAGMAARYEEILRALVADTEANEPGCLRYEYWRGAEPNAYYCLLSFENTQAFYLHQSSAAAHRGRAAARRDAVAHA